MESKAFQLRVLLLLISHNWAIDAIITHSLLPYVSEIHSDKYKPRVRMWAMPAVAFGP